MDKLTKLVVEIAYTVTAKPLSPLQKFFVPFLVFCSSVYSLSIFVRERLYHAGVFRKHRMPVPVVSVGNLTWGGNGKTPMVEFVARILCNSGLSPLILTRGYCGSDEAKMLQAHLSDTSVRIGVGANRSAAAAKCFEKYGYLDHMLYENRKGDKIGAIVLDDGMQHWSLVRNLEIVMINGMAPWGNGHLLPRGPLREPLASLKRADVVVIHHADLVSYYELEVIELAVREIKRSIPIFISKLSPSHFFEIRSSLTILPLHIVEDKVVLCVSGIGFASAFIKTVEKMHPIYVDRIDFSDHHFIDARDIAVIKEKLKSLEQKFCLEPFVVVTEKDYYRDPLILKELDARVLVLCSCLQILSVGGMEMFEMILKQLMDDARDKMAIGSG